jgi:hypothetical protein
VFEGYDVFGLEASVSCGFRLPQLAFDFRKSIFSRLPPDGNLPSQSPSFVFNNGSSYTADLVAKGTEAQRRCLLEALGVRPSVVSSILRGQRQLLLELKCLLRMLLAAQLEAERMIRAARAVASDHNLVLVIVLLGKYSAWTCTVADPAADYVLDVHACGALPHYSAETPTEAVARAARELRDPTFAQNLADFGHN